MPTPATRRAQATRSLRDVDRVADFIARRIVTGLNDVESLIFATERAFPGLLLMDFCAALALFQTRAGCDAYPVARHVQ